MKSLKYSSSASALLLALAASPSLLAATFISTSTTGTNNWSTATGWDSTPVSAIDTTLTFGNGTALAASATVTSSNDIGSPPFRLNALNMTYAGPASGTAPTVTISGSQLEFINDLTPTAPSIVFNTTGTIKPTVNIANAILFTNTAAINATTNATFNGTLSGTGGFTKSGAGTMIIQGNATATGGTALGNIGVSAGTLQIGNNGGFGSLGAGTITLSGSGSLNVSRASNSFNFDNTISGSTSGAVNFFLNNSATPTAFEVTLTKANTYTAATNLQPFSASSVGTPTLKNGIDNALSTTTAFSINTVSGSTANMTYDLAGFNQTLASLASGAGVTTTNGIVTNSGAAKTLNLSNASGTTTYSGTISGAIALTKSGASTQILGGSNSYSGLTTVNAGVLQVNNSNALGSTAAGTTVNGSDGSVNFLGTVLDLNGVAIGSGETLNLDTGTTLNNRVTLRSMSGTTSSWAGSVVLAGDRLVQIQTGDGTSQMTVSGAISGPSYTGTTLNLRGAGTGTLSGGITLGTNTNIQVLDGGTWNINTSSNTLGTTNITNGTLVTGAANALPGSQFVSLGGGSTSGTLRLNGFNQSVGGLAISGTGTANKIVNGSATASTLTLSNPSANSTFSGVLGGVGANENNFGLTKAGAATLTLTGSNTYTGVTTVNAGTLATSTTGSFGTGNISVGTASLNLGNNTSIADGASLFLLSTSTLTLGFASGFETISGLFIAGNAVSIGTYTATQLGNLGFGGTFNGAGQLQVTSVIPEPSTYAALAGLAALGLAMRRRSRA